MKKRKHRTSDAEYRAALGLKPGEKIPNKLGQAEGGGGRAREKRSNRMVGDKSERTVRFEADRRGSNGRKRKEKK